MFFKKKFGIENTTQSEQIWDMKSQYKDVFQNCLNCKQELQKVHLRKIYELSESLDSLVRGKHLWKEFMKYKNEIDNIMKSYPEESNISQRFFTVNYELGRDILRFYSYNDHVTEKLIENLKARKFMDSQVLEDVENDPVLRDFRSYITCTYICLKTLENRFEFVISMAEKLVLWRIKNGEI